MALMLVALLGPRPGRRPPSRCCFLCCGLLCGKASGALAVEFVLHLGVDDALAFDLGELHDLAFGHCFEVLVLHPGRCGCLLALLEFGLRVGDVTHQCVEFVEVDGGPASCDGREPFGGEPLVHVIEVDEERHGRGAAIDETPRSQQLQLSAHLAGAGVCGVEVGLCLGDLDVEFVEFGFGVEHGLGCSVGAIARRLNLACSLFGLGPTVGRLGADRRHGSEQQGGAGKKHEGAPAAVRRH